MFASLGRRVVPFLKMFGAHRVPWMRDALYSIARFTAPRTLKYDVDGYRIVLTPRESWMDFSLYWFGYWEKEATDVLDLIIKEGMTVVDVGASNGYYSLRAAHRVGPQGQVYAFEPEELFFDRLTKNIALNRGVPVECLKLALADYEGKSDFFLSGFAGDQKADTTTLDRFVQEHDVHSINVVKIDIEGNELRALRGMEKTLKANPGIIVLCEVHPRDKHDHGLSVREYHDLIRLLNAHNLELFAVEYAMETVRPRARGFVSPSPFHVLAFDPAHHSALASEIRQRSQNSSKDA